MSIPTRRNRFTNETVRVYIALGLAASIVCALAIATIYGFLAGNFDGLHVVWAVTAPFVGALVAYYFPLAASP